MAELVLPDRAVYCKPDQVVGAEMKLMSEFLHILCNCRSDCCTDLDKLRRECGLLDAVGNGVADDLHRVFDQGFEGAIDDGAAVAAGNRGEGFEGALGDLGGVDEFHGRLT